MLFFLLSSCKPSVRQRVWWNFASHHWTAMFISACSYLSNAMSVPQCFVMQRWQKASMRITQLSDHLCTIIVYGVNKYCDKWTCEQVYWWQLTFLWCFAIYWQYWWQAQAAYVSTTQKVYKDHKSSHCLINELLTLEAMRDRQRESLSPKTAN